MRGYAGTHDLLGLELDIVLSDIGAWFAFDPNAHDANMSKAIEAAGDALDRASSLRLHDLTRAARQRPLHVKRSHKRAQRDLRGAA